MMTALEGFLLALALYAAWGAKADVEEMRGQHRWAKIYRALSLIHGGVAVLVMPTMLVGLPS